MYYEFQNLNDAVLGLSRAILMVGHRERRGKNFAGNETIEFPGCTLIRIVDPTDRYIRIPARKWNKTLGWIESLWLARGENWLEMPAAYVKNLVNFSDDGETMRAGYGPRIRCYGDHNVSYKGLNGEWYNNQYLVRRGLEKEFVGWQVDQLKFVLKKFKEDLGTREAVITIHDPVADDFTFKDGEQVVLPTKDTPCTRSIHFMVVDGKMNCYVDIRSNDLIWGFSAVNVFNFTLMQEYVAAMVGVPVGEYFHKADNLHVYEGSLDMVKEIAKTDAHLAPIDTSTKRFTYVPTYHTLEEFDSLISALSDFEAGCRCDVDLPYDDEEAIEVLGGIKDPLFSDWARIIYRKWSKKSVKFVNPMLNELFG